jgi:hypothetical protein
VIALHTEAPVRVITFAPQATQIFQVFDVTLFGVLKRRPRFELPFGDEYATVQCIMKVSAVTKFMTGEILKNLCRFWHIEFFIYTRSGLLPTMRPVFMFFSARIFEISF